MRLTRATASFLCLLQTDPADVLCLAFAFWQNTVAQNAPNYYQLQAPVNARQLTFQVSRQVSKHCHANLLTH